MRFEGFATRAILPIDLQVFKYLIRIPAGFHRYKPLTPHRSPLSTAIETASARFFRFIKVLTLEKSLTSGTVLEAQFVNITSAHWTLSR